MQPDPFERHYSGEKDCLTAYEMQGESGATYIDAMNVSEETLRELLKTNRPLRFDWENKWLRGDQYAHMLNNIDAYGQAFGMPKLAEK